MNFSETFIRRPVATVLLTAGIVLLGAIAYVRLPIASLPILERPIIAVRAGLPGGSSSTVAAAVTAPLEKQLGLISGLREMASTSIYGRSGILMEFDLNKNIDAAAGEVQAAIFAAGPSLPPTCKGRRFTSRPIRTAFQSLPSGLPRMCTAFRKSIASLIAFWSATFANRRSRQGFS